jgi:6-phosphogluconolactonase/glucosamine-6-phosphate isomerase/deaminase
MTLTYEALAHADRLLWLVTGADKRAALSALLRGDTTIPAGGVRAPDSLVMADSAAMAT